MKSILNKIIPALMITLFITCFVNNLNAAQDTKGNEFWLMFNDNSLGSQTLSLFVTTSDAGVVVDVTGPFAPILGVPIPAGTITTISIPAGAMVTSNDIIEPKGIHLVTQNPVHEVTVYGLNRAQYTTDAYLGLPVDILGTEYYPLGFLNNNVLGTLFGIVGTTAGTQVEIIPSATTMGHTAGIPYIQALGAGDVYQLKNESNGGADLSGTRIRVVSGGPIAVFGGHKCSNVPVVFYCCCDHIVEMVPPTSTWGRNFVTFPLATRLNGDSWRFLAKDNGTTITVTPGPVIPVLNAGDVYDVILTSAAVINSNNPILVAQYSNSSFYDGVTSDPFEMLIPPYEQFLPSYVVSTPASGFTNNFLNIVAPTSIVPAGVLVDGLNVAGWLPIGGGFSGVQVPVALNSHSVTGTLPVGVFSYGFADYDSYGYPGGQSLSPVAVVTNLDATPEFSTNLVGQTHCVDALVTDQFNSPVVGIRVDFQIIGANPGNGFAFSNTLGVAQYCYVGSHVGCDTIICTTGNLVDTVYKCWQPALPVELSAFTASVNRKDITLNWSTSEEINNSGFDLERKTVDATEWTKITFVQGNGNTNEPKNYTFTDKNLNAGKYNYRLKQIDFNGNFQYFTLSSEVEISVPAKFDLMQNYPNPFNPTTKIDFEIPRDGNVMMTVYDNSGKLVSTIVNEFKSAGYYTVQFTPTNLSSGVYFYKLESNGFTKIMKMTLLK